MSLRVIIGTFLKYSTNENQQMGFQLLALLCIDGHPSSRFCCRFIENKDTQEKPNDHHMRHRYVQWNLHIADIFGTNFDVHCREVSAVWRCHPLFYCILDENICPLFGGVRCAEVSVIGGSTVRA